MRTEARERTDLWGLWQWLSVASMTALAAATVTTSVWKLVGPQTPPPPVDPALSRALIEEREAHLRTRLHLDELRRQAGRPTADLIPPQRLPTGADPIPPAAP